MDRRAGETVDHGEGPAVLGRPPEGAGRARLPCAAQLQGFEGDQEWAVGEGGRAPDAQPD